jgi:TusE/DsrC/DsvC family sulfur relay protein
MTIQSTMATDEEGYLVNPQEWTSMFAQWVAREEELDLDQNHWVVIWFIRDYFEEHQVIPDVRHVTAYLSTEMRVHKKKSKAILFDMFPYGYVKQACKVAGMRRPRAWSTG